jgi:nitrogenase molybdenum-iron protein alpha/beta subunit
MSLKSYEHCCSSAIALATLGKVEGVIPILHGPQACIFNNQLGTMFCRPSRLITVGTLLNRSEVIFGGEENLKEQIRKVSERYKPKIVVIINTCVPQLIGEDVKGVIIDLKSEIPDLKVTYCDTGFNHPRAMPLGSDTCWAAIVNVLDKKEKVKGSIGLLGRSGQDAGCLGPLTNFIREAGIPIFVFPAAHIEEMEKIVQAEILCPIHVVPYLTCKRLSERFGSRVEYLEIPVGIEGTSRFLRGIADLVGNQKLRAIVDREEKRILPRWRAIQKQFAQNPIKVMNISGPANEISVGKVLAELGAKVTIVPSVRNKFAQVEKKILEERYGVTFVEEDFDTVSILVNRYQPDVVFTEFQGRIEVLPKFTPAQINVLYVTEYGYDWALDFGEHFFDNLRMPVYKKWQSLMERYRGKHHHA